ncbi:MULTISPECIES: hypothetical protein [unclassified Natrinema]|uniref:Uncharacterized protein n=1 Tax=Saline Natrinema sp. J7-1 virus 2 TaxID=2847286 RepID=A0A976XGS3_9VIRU|nr:MULTISPECIES: hypothetical protein [unclassified Natrinema]YP_010772547.1 hypothetical protein QIT43_gp24 [Saline Natrinema sp. J7-1 virus 2]AFO55970.1 hypothetical protein NJ7G_0714 [Natrinema sp. J7-2]UUT36795.1 hypothetical protein SNJ2_gp24 [Saline Natrinema sp. J7-1 virus 2]
MHSGFVRASRLYDVASRTPIAHPTHQATDEDVRHALEDREVCTDGGQSSTDTEQNGLIYIYWAACKSCGYTTALHGRAACPDCDEMMAPYAIAGAIVDDEPRTQNTGGDR